MRRRPRPPRCHRPAAHYRLAPPAPLRLRSSSPGPTRPARRCTIRALEQLFTASPPPQDAGHSCLTDGSGNSSLTDAAAGPCLAGPVGQLDWQPENMQRNSLVDPGPDAGLLAVCPRRSRPGRVGRRPRQPGVRLVSRRPQQIGVSGAVHGFVDRVVACIRAGKPSTLFCSPIIGGK